MRILGLVALVALLQTNVALAGLIILPDQTAKKNCWVWMVPPATVHKSAADFLSRMALGLLPKNGLAQPGHTTLELLNQLNAGRLRIEIKEAQTQPFALTSDRLTLSMDAADTLVRARNDDPAQLLETQAAVDPRLATAWLEQLGTGKTNLWDVTETRLRWRHAATGAAPETFALSSLELARKLWPHITEARTEDEVLIVAQSFGAEHLREFADNSQALHTSGLAGELVNAFIQQGDYRTAFLELGLRAARLIAAQRQVDRGEIKRLAAAPLLQKLQDDYNEVYSLLARQLQAGLLIIPHH